MTEAKHPHNREIPPSESVETQEGDVAGQGSGVTTATAGSQVAEPDGIQGTGKVSAETEVDPEVDEDEDEDEEEEDDET